MRRVADVLRIAPLLGKRPSALSGGDMQRVAIGRALVRRPKALLMDEPIGALDAKLREAMRAEIKRLHMAQGSTSIYVTHDQVEAMSLADRIVVMHEGVLQQVGTPDEVYAHPANLFVAQFVGSPVMNVAEARLAGEAGEARVAMEGRGEGFRFAGGAARPGRRRRRARHPPGGGAGGARRARRLPGRGGADHRAARLPRHRGPERSASRCCGRGPPAVSCPGRGERVWARIDPAQAHFFDAASGASLGVRL